MNKLRLTMRNIEQSFLSSVCGYKQKNCELNLKSNREKGVGGGAS